MSNRNESYFGLFSWMIFIVTCVHCCDTNHQVRQLQYTVYSNCFTKDSIDPLQESAFDGAKKAIESLFKKSLD